MPALSKKEDYYGWCVIGKKEPVGDIGVVGRVVVSYFVASHLDGRVAVDASHALLKVGEIKKWKG